MKWRVHGCQHSRHRSLSLLDFLANTRKLKTYFCNLANGLQESTVSINTSNTSITAHRTSLYSSTNLGWHQLTESWPVENRMAIWTVSRLVIHKKPCVWGQEIPSLSCRKSLTPGLPGPLIGPSCCLQKILAVWLYLSFLSCQTIQTGWKFNLVIQWPWPNLIHKVGGCWRSFSHLKGSKVNAPSPKKGTTSRCTQNRITCFFLFTSVYRLSDKPRGMDPKLTKVRHGES